MTNLIEVNDVAEAILEHVNDMEGYTLPALDERFMAGWDHALRLFRRDALFLGYKIVEKQEA